MVDDFHGSEQWRGINEWEVFVDSMTKVFPDRPDRGPPQRRSDFPHDLRFGRALSGAGRAVVPVRAGHTKRVATGRPPHWRCDSRRQGPDHGGDLPQHGSGRCLGVVGRPALSGEMGVAGVPDRDELFHLRSDALTTRTCVRATTRSTEPRATATGCCGPSRIRSLRSRFSANGLLRTASNPVLLCE